MFNKELVEVETESVFSNENTDEQYEDLFVEENEKHEKQENTNTEDYNVVEG